MYSLLYVYAFKANAHIVHGMICCCIGMKRMGYRKSSILNLLSFLLMLVESHDSPFALTSFQVRESLELAGAFSGAGSRLLNHGTMCRALLKIESWV